MSVSLENPSSGEGLRERHVTHAVTGAGEKDGNLGSEGHKGDDVEKSPKTFGKTPDGSGETELIFHGF
jgi:hypothetical protein